MANAAKTGTALAVGRCGIDGTGANDGRAEEGAGQPDGATPSIPAPIRKTRPVRPRPGGALFL